MKRLTLVSVIVLLVAVNANAYSWITPYAYCAWNPLRFVDPDGMEKHIFLDKVNQQNLYDAAVNYADNIPTIHIWAHGDSQTVIFYNNETNTPYIANTVDKLVSYLNDNVFSASDAWKKHISEGSQAVIVLHACETGKGENSIAQQLSEQLPNTVIIAPNENVAVTLDQKELGSYKTKEFIKTDDKGDKIKSLQTNGVGAWVMFRGGEKLGSFNGATKPNASHPEQFHIDNQLQ